jgi:hypothetical protein
LSRYFFNEAGYETREEFRPFEGSAWTLERVLDPNSNAAVRVILHCQTAKIPLPLELDTRLSEAGESRITYLGETCERAEKKVQKEPTSENEQ